MTGDDLNTPLGYDPTASARPARRALPWRAMGVGAGVIGVVGLVIAIKVTDTGMGAEPFAVAKIEIAPKRVAPPLPPVSRTTASADGASPAPATSGRMNGDAAELESGVKVVRQGGGGAPGALIIQVPADDVLGIHLPPSPDKRLVEKGRFGNLPRIGADGSRPAEVYGRPFITGEKLPLGAPRISLVVGGMGLSQTATQGAASKLPGAVTLAFAPYGADLERQVARVRDQGHEVILQLPMESFDPAQSPGPHTLTLAASPEQSLDDIHWLMSRFTGYVGVSSFLGARFLASEPAVTPVLREAAARGLLYFDDGGAAQSAIATVAATNGAVVLRADVVLDVTPKPEAVEAELLKLEAIARRKGFAIGFATGLPATVDQLARFARGLEKRGIALAPLSSQAAFASVPTARIER